MPALAELTASDSRVLVFRAKTRTHAEYLLWAASRERRRGRMPALAARLDMTLDGLWTALHAEADYCARREIIARIQFVERWQATLRSFMGSAAFFQRFEADPIGVKIELLEQAQREAEAMKTFTESPLSMSLPDRTELGERARRNRQRVQADLEQLRGQRRRAVQERAMRPRTCGLSSRLRERRAQRPAGRRCRAQGTARAPARPSRPSDPDGEPAPRRPLADRALGGAA